LAGNAITETDARGQRILDDTLLILFNATHAPCTFTLPDEPAAQGAQGQWELALDTRYPTLNALPADTPHHFPVDASYTLEALSLAVFAWPRGQ
jgi:glycogen operon protein